MSRKKESPRQRRKRHVLALTRRAARHYMIGKWFAYVIPFGDGRLRSKAGRRALRDIRRRHSVGKPRTPDPTTGVVTGYGPLALAVVQKQKDPAVMEPDWRVHVAAPRPTPTDAVQQEVGKLFANMVMREPLPTVVHVIVPEGVMNAITREYPLEDEA